MKNITLPASVGYTKSSISEHSQLTIDKVEFGVIDALHTYVEAKIAAEYFNNIIKGLKESAFDEAEKYGKSSDNKIHGCSFECTSGITRYDYSHDDVWSNLNNEKLKITALMKAREDLMKKATSFSGVCDENGEEIPPAKVSGGTSSAIKITIPK